MANFLLAWHNARENGGWDLTDLWDVDNEIAEDMMLALTYIRHNREYLNERRLGYRKEIEAIWEFWRGGQAVTDYPDAPLVKSPGA